jgi:DNA polymerase III subunit epsilon
VSTAWLDEVLYGLDLGTTSSWPADARIINASIVVIEHGKQVRDLSWLAAPDVEVSSEATVTENITSRNSLTAGDVAIEVARQLKCAWDHGHPVVIFNAPYDLTVLDHELVRHGFRQGLEAFTAVGPVLDPLVLDRYVDRYREGSRTLNDTTEHYGLSAPRMHTTKNDTLAALRLMWKIARRWQRIGTMTLEELQAVQTDVYRDTQRSFAKYLRTTVVYKICAEAALLLDDGRAAKLVELSELLARADSVEAGAHGWPLQRARDAVAPSSPHPPIEKAS